MSTISQLKKENAKLAKAQTKKQQLRELNAENYRLKHPRTVAFVKGLKGAGSVVATHLAPRKTMRGKMSRKGKRSYKPFSINDLI